MDAKPNIIERLENALAFCDELRTTASESNQIGSDLDNIEGIISEILTMIDGR